jgi:uncharacterized protein (TIGR02246 family)
MKEPSGIGRRGVLMAGAVALAGGSAGPGARAIAPQLDLNKAADPPSVRAELSALLQRQAAQWSAGDLVGFCAHYADDAVFVSPSGRTDGRAAVLARYQKKYVDKKGMGALSLEVLHVAESGALASIVMTWRLVFQPGPSGAKEPAQGYSVIALQKQKGAWKIVHDASM